MKWKTAAIVVILAVLVYIIWGYLENDDFDTGLLRGKNVVVTGASSGFGEQMAYLYAGYGANVFITARREELLKKIISNCKSIAPSSAKVGYVAADMTLEEDREKVIHRAIDFFGDIDQLILNHALMSPVQIWNGSDKQINDLKRIINVNFIAFAHLTGLALPSLTRTKGCVGVVGSLTGRQPLPYLLEYTASKFAVDGFFSGLRHEFKMTKQNVSITMGTIGVVVTDAASDTLDRLFAVLKSPEKIPVTQMYRPEALDAAYAIIKATTERRGELYFPKQQYLRVQTILRSIAPQFAEDWSNIFEPK